MFAQTMQFAEWLRHKGLSDSSIGKYVGAIKGPISQWAREHALVEGSLTGLVSATAFARVATGVRALPIFQERNRNGRDMYGAALNRYAEYLQEGFGSDLEADLDAIVAAPEMTVTEKQRLVALRVGQGMFRQQLLNYWQGCAVTGFADPGLLVASHIKPWRVSSHAERLDPFNGLLLTPNLDRAFDLGFMTFEVSGRIALSPMFVEPQRLGITPGLAVCLTPRHEPFMAFHRTQVFRAA